MKNIAIGDKVRVLRGTEEGIVVSIKRDIIEIEIEDGFTIPVLDKDLVVVSNSEREHFGGYSTSDQEVVAQDTFVTTATGEVYVGMMKNQNSGGYQVSIINHTMESILYYTYRKQGSRWFMIDAGQLEHLTYQTLRGTVSESEEISINYVRLADQVDAVPNIVKSSFRVKPQWFLKELSTIPLLRTVGYFFPVGKALAPIDPDQLKNAMFDQGSSETKSSYSPVGDLLDLHIEELTDTPERFAKNELLPFQIEAFESYLDKAISAGNDDLTVVHGVGNGILKHNIQKKLSGHPHVAYFKDAQKEKFGYGALYIKFK
jgi:hypothetical protein